MLGGGNQVPAATDGNSEPTRRPRGGTSSPTVPQASRGEPYGKTKIVSTRDFAEFARPPAVHETSGFQAVWPGTPRTRSGWFPIPHPLPLSSSPTPPSAHTPPRPSSRLFPPREWAQGFQTADSKPRIPNPGVWPTFLVVPTVSGGPDLPDTNLTCPSNSGQIRRTAHSRSGSKAWSTRA